MEREATPKLMVQFGIQLYLSGLSLSDTVSFLNVSDVNRVRSTVHNSIHETDLQSESGLSRNHAAVDEILIQLDDEYYWLCAGVDPQPNDLSHAKLEPTRTAISD